MLEVRWDGTRRRFGRREPLYAGRRRADFTPANSKGGTVSPSTLRISAVMMLSPRLLDTLISRANTSRLLITPLCMKIACGQWVTFSQIQSRRGHKKYQKRDERISARSDKEEAVVRKFERDFQIAKAELNAAAHRAKHSSTPAAKRQLVRLRAEKDHAERSKIILTFYDMRTTEIL